MIGNPNDELFNTYEWFMSTLRKQIDRARMILDQYHYLDRNEVAENYIKQLCKIATSVERFALTTRKSFSYLGFRNAINTTDDIIIKSFPCHMGFTDDKWFVIDMPPIPMKKAPRADVVFFCDSLRTVMENYFPSLSGMRYVYPWVCVIFRNIYGPRSTALPYNRSKDYAHILTELDPFILPCPSPESIHIMVRGESGTEDHTLVYVVPQFDLLKFVALADEGKLDTLEIYPTPQNNGLF